MIPRKFCGFEMGALAWAMHLVRLVEEAHAPAVARDRAAWPSSRPIAQSIPNDRLSTDAPAGADDLIVIGGLLGGGDRGHYSPERRYRAALVATLYRSGVARLAGSAPLGPAGGHQPSGGAVLGGMLAGYAA